jgi:hypothetical protein
MSFGECRRKGNEGKLFPLQEIIDKKCIVENIQSTCPYLEIPCE